MMFKQLAPTFIGIGIFIAAIIFFSSIYIVDETKQVFVTRFGEIVREPINAPGKRTKPATIFDFHSSPKCTSLRNAISSGMAIPTR